MDALESRLREGDSIKIGVVEVNKPQFVRRTAEAGDSVRSFGQPDRLKLLFKAQSEDWLKSTKAMQLPTGCLVQVTNQQRQDDGSWMPAEALAFVPGVAIRDEQDGNGCYLDRLSAGEDEASL